MFITGAITPHNRLPTNFRQWGLIMSITVSSARKKIFFGCSSRVGCNRSEYSLFAPGTQKGVNNLNSPQGYSSRVGRSSGWISSIHPWNVVQELFPPLPNQLWLIDPKKLAAVWVTGDLEKVQFRLQEEVSEWIKNYQSWPVPNPSRSWGLFHICCWGGTGGW